MINGVIARSQRKAFSGRLKPLGQKLKTEFDSHGAFQEGRLQLLELFHHSVKPAILLKLLACQVSLKPIVSPRGETV